MLGIGQWGEIEFATLRRCSIVGASSINPRPRRATSSSLQPGELRGGNAPGSPPLVVRATGGQGESDCYLAISHVIHIIIYTISLEISIITMIHGRTSLCPHPSFSEADPATQSGPGSPGAWGPLRGRRPARRSAPRRRGGDVGWRGGAAAATSAGGEVGGDDVCVPRRGPPPATAAGSPAAAGASS